MDRRFVIVSGLPGSGKSRLAGQLGAALGLRILDKDEILEELFESRGVGDVTWRRTLSRESDRIFEIEASGSDGAVLVSHWRLPGMPMDSGTPTTWLAGLSANIVHVHCTCPPELALGRLVQRARHPGHLDEQRSRPEILASLEQLAGCGRLDLEPCVEVDTSRPVDIDGTLRQLLKWFEVAAL
jgi:glucokinase